MPELLLELFSEEIPARMQLAAADDLKRLVTKGLAAAGLAHERTEAFATPRRLALVVNDLPARQPDTREERRGPKADAPAKAVEGFLASVGLSREQVEERETPKGTFLFAVVEREGRATAAVLKEVIETALGEFPWPKSMRWGDGETRWVRPLHRLLCVFDGAVVPVEFAGIAADNLSQGHRFLGREPFEVRDFADYRDKLRLHHVVLDHYDRQRMIEEQAAALAATAGLNLNEDGALVVENAGLTEWPVCMLGAIDAAFMDVPAEALISAMRNHQKYFALSDDAGAMAPRFVLTANIDAADGGAGIVAGNERVLRARLADAKFFWDQDRKTRLEDRVAQLGQIVFHKKLGTVADKVERVTALALKLEQYVPGATAEENDVARAAQLCKADLTAGMVGEFPELQGTMGRYYALNDGENERVALAIEEHYKPLGPNDECPTAPVSVAVALADKLDTLVGFWAIDEKPTGSKDPYALRRAALGIIRLVLENDLRLPLRDAFDAAAEVQGVASVANELMGFFAERLKVHLRERGVRHDLITAVFAQEGEEKGEDDLVRLFARADALQDFLNSEDGANLLTAYGRAANIVRAEEKKDGTVYAGAVDEAKFAQEEEARLHTRITEAQRDAEAALGEEDYVAAMAALAALRGPVDEFFDAVTVNAEDPVLRVNRLNLLAEISATLDRVADFSQIEG